MGDENQDERWPGDGDDPVTGQLSAAKILEARDLMRLGRQPNMTLEQYMDWNDLKLAEGSIRFEAFGKSLRENTKLTRETNENTKEMVSLFKAAQGGAKIVGWWGRFWKRLFIWLAAVAGGISAVIALFSQMGGD